jgi:predicted ribosome quality control (RQC) complex YloA/Tae2 family protein
LLSNDSIIKIGYERKEEKGSLILEMFGKGNLIIVDEQMKALLALQTHEFTDRSVRKSETYKPPKNECVDLGDMKAVEAVFSAIGTAQAADRMVSYLSKRLGLGSLYIDDAIRRQGLDPKIKVKDVDEKTLKAIKQRIIEIIEGQGKAIVYMKDGMPEDIAVAEIDKYSAMEKRELPLNEAVELFYSSRPKVVSESNEEVERIEASLKRQEEIIKEMQREEIACRAKGEFISTNVTALNNLIKLASSKRAEEEELKKAATGFKIKRIDRAKRSITIETDDAK